MQRYTDISGSAIANARLATPCGSGSYVRYQTDAPASSAQSRRIKWKDHTMLHSAKAINGYADRLDMNRLGRSVGAFFVVALLIGAACQPLAAKSATLARTDAQTQARLIHTGMPAGPETNSAGDIPDSQVFITYRSSQGYAIKVPEGWARSEQPGSVRFSDKYNTVRIDLSPRATAPTLVEVRAEMATMLKQQAKALKIVDVRSSTLPAGKVVIARFQAESEANPVTGRAIRLDSENIYLWHAGQQAVITLSAPTGADNVDQWHLMANSFAWTPAKP
jgi:hypothetical protein